MAATNNNEGLTFAALNGWILWDWLVIVPNAARFGAIGPLFLVWKSSRLLLLCPWARVSMLFSSRAGFTVETENMSIACERMERSRFLVNSQQHLSQMVDSSYRPKRCSSFPKSTRSKVPSFEAPDIKSWAVVETMKLLTEQRAAARWIPREV